jgi:hypothetical protein
MPKGLFRVSPGYYTALGDRALSFDRPVTRVYFNVSAEGAVACVRLLTTRLNAAGIPFRLKAVNVRGPAYDRADSLVVYLAGDQSDGWRTIILEAAGQLAPQLGSATPSMTRPVSRGVATAADPGDGQSFGMHRCGLLAEGIVLAWERRSPAIDAVRETWAAAGVDVSAPYGRRDLAGWI